MYAIYMVYLYSEAFLIIQNLWDVPICPVSADLPREPTFVGARSLIVLALRCFVFWIDNEMNQLFFVLPLVDGCCGGHEQVSRWFGDRSDLILVLFDAHRLDVSDELMEVRTVVSCVFLPTGLRHPSVGG